MNSTVECTKDHNTYLVSVRKEGQKPVLKRIMRLTVGLFKIIAKIDLKVNGFYRMKVNSLNSSYFRQNSAMVWTQHLHIFFGSLKVKIYFKGNSKTEVLLIAFRTDNKRDSYEIDINVNRAIGEVLSKDFEFFRKDGRGFIVSKFKI